MCADQRGITTTLDAQQTPWIRPPRCPSQRAAAPSAPPRALPRRPSQLGADIVSITPATLPDEPSVPPPSRIFPPSILPRGRRQQGSPEFQESPRLDKWIFWVWRSSRQCGRFCRASEDAPGFRQAPFPCLALEPSHFRALPPRATASCTCPLFLWQRA